MDSDFWTSRIAAAKRQYTLNHHNQTSHLDRLSVEEFEVEEDVRPDIPCPYCYEDFDVSSLCSHLEDEHPCESRATSVSFVSYESDHLVNSFCIDELRYLRMHSTFVLADYMQRRRRLRRVAIPNSQALSLLGRDLREAHLQVLLGGGGTGGYRSSTSSANASTAAATDPFLSSLILNFPSSEVEEVSKSVVASAEEESFAKKSSSVSPYVWRASIDPSLSPEEREKRIKQAAGRASFVQNLVLSTLSLD
ncbi:Protein DEHYDRATION-INDUCED 19 [Linum perenne]